MKKRIQPFLVIIALAAVVSSCNDKEILYQQEYDFSIRHNNQLHKIETKENLVSFFRDYKDLGNAEIEILSMEKTYNNDTQNWYYGFMAKYTLENGHTINFAMPFEIKTTDDNTLVLAAGDCEMTCVPAELCPGCEQTIHEMCKRQTCKCTLTASQCTAKTVFNSSSDN